MADNIYLLETRLSKAQRAALGAVREVSRAKGLTVFLVGGAVRDLIGGTAVRDLDVAVQGIALKIKKDIEKAGGVIAGEMEAGQAFYVRFPGGVRMEIRSRGKLCTSRQRSLRTCGGETSRRMRWRSR